LRPHGQLYTLVFRTETGVPIAESRKNGGNMRIRTYNDTAVVTALISTKGKYMGQEFITEERATDIFVKHNGEWQSVISQLTRLSKKP
jgi:hypothetical protein